MRLCGGAKSAVATRHIGLRLGCLLLGEAEQLAQRRRDRGWQDHSAQAGSEVAFVCSFVCGRFPPRRLVCDSVKLKLSRLVAVATLARYALELSRSATTPWSHAPWSARCSKAIMPRA